MNERKDGAHASLGRYRAKKTIAQRCVAEGASKTYAARPRERRIYSNAFEACKASGPPHVPTNGHCGDAFRCP